MEGNDVLDLVTLPVNTTVGQVFYTKLLNPAHWPNAQAKVVSSLYEKMRWERLEITVRSFAGANIAGGIMGALFIDSHTRMPPTGGAVIIKFESQEHHISVSLHSQKTLVWRNPECDFVDTSRQPDMGKFSLTTSAYPQQDVPLMISVKWVGRFLGRTVQQFDQINDFTIRPGTLYTLKGGDPEREGGCVNYSAGSSAGDLKVAYDASSFDDIYQIFPPLAGPLPSSPARFCRSSNFVARSAGFVFYSTLNEAINAGSNPDRNTATGFVQVDPATLLTTVPQLRFHRLTPDQYI